MTEPDRSLGKSLGLALAIAALLGIAAAGGSIVRGTGKTATATQAFPYAMMGALAGIVMIAIVFAAVRMARPGALHLSPGELLAIVFIAAALGALIGAALTPRTPDAEDVSELDERDIDQREAEAGEFGESTRAGSVDRDGDGRPDVDENGDPIIAYDSDGDGQLDGFLEPCPPGTGSAPARPGYTPIDNDCDGTIDEWLPYDPNQVLTNDGRLEPSPPATISPEERQERADEQGADGKRGTVLRNLLLILLAIGVGAAIIAYLVRMPDRKQDDTDTPVDAPPEPPKLDLSKSFEASLDAMLEDPDPRQGICAAYGRLLDGLAEVGLPRRTEEAPEEHIRRCLATARMDPAPVRQLLDLFSLARFSTHPVSEEHRLAAVKAMRAALASTERPAEPELVAAGAAPSWAPPGHTG